MSLPEQTRSLWQEAPAPPVRPPLVGEVEADVCVVGGGLTGVTTAYLLAREGVSVVLLEGDRLGAGATGRTTGKVTSQHGLLYGGLRSRVGAEGARLFGRAQEEALAWVRETVVREGLECDWTEAPAYVWAETEEEVASLKAEAEAVRDLGLPGSLVDGDVGLPWRVARALRFDGQAMFHALRYVRGLAERLEAVGGVVHEDSRVTGVGVTSPVRVATAGGSVRARTVVLATLTPLVDRGGQFARTRPSRSYLVAAEHASPPPAMYLSAGSPTRTVRSHQDATGTYVIAGGGGHPTGQGDPAGDAAAAADFLRRRFDASPAWSWSAQDFLTSSGVPHVGPALPHLPGVLVATGFGKWGMTGGTAAARTLADLVLEKESPYAELFSPQRTELPSVLRTLVQQGGHTVASWVAGAARSLGAGDLPGVEEVEAGTGRLARREGRVVAAYRDGEGTLHTVDPHCTHLGCSVAFNPVERSWDCPCHGSRFGTDGRVLEGPATAPLGAATGAEPRGGDTP